jgi:hypothetical protein
MAATITDIIILPFKCFVLLENSVPVIFVVNLCSRSSSTANAADGQLLRLEMLIIAIPNAEIIEAVDSIVICAIE